VCTVYNITSESNKYQIYINVAPAATLFQEAANNQKSKRQQLFLCWKRKKTANEMFHFPLKRPNHNLKMIEQLDFLGRIQKKGAQKNELNI